MASRCNLYNGKSLLWIFLLKKTTKAASMKVFMISFRSNSHIVAKFQIDRFRDCDTNQAEKNIEITVSKPYMLVYTARGRRDRVKKLLLCWCSGLWLMIVVAMCYMG